MNINLDDDLKQSRRRLPEEHRVSMSQLLFVIVLGVFIANMLSWGAQRGIDYLVAKEMLRQATEEMAEINARTQAKLEEQRRINAVVAKQRETENQKREAGLRQAMETCTYWREQYRKDGSSYNRLQRDQSCNFVSEFR
jgi:hypothetical protein